MYENNCRFAFPVEKLASQKHKTPDSRIRNVRGA